MYKKIQFSSVSYSFAHSFIHVVVCILFHSEFFTECDLVLPLIICSYTLNI
jgi:hypothetical protein